MRFLSSLLAFLRELLTNRSSQRNINYGGDQNIFNQPKHVNFYSSSNRLRNEQILLRAVQDEVESRLANSLHNAVFLILGKEAQPEQVKRPWDWEIKIGTKKPTAIPGDMTIAQVFDSIEINGKLLILGSLGSGKTTTLLDLAKALIEKALGDASYPIPVLFNLSSWQDETQSIRDWMIAELRSKYGVNPKLGQHWMRERILLPLLDGLDEVAPGREEKCVKQINSFLIGESSPIYAVVCSRTAQYENYETPLQLNGAVYLKELNDQQIQEYLARVERKDLWQLLAHNSTLLEFVRAPLLLSIAVLAYDQDETAQWRRLEAVSDQLQYLLDAYVERMLHRPLRNRSYGKQRVPSTKQTRGWLIWLAQQMEQTSQTSFLIEGMQPSLLPIAKQKKYRIILGLILGLIQGILLGPFLVLTYGFTNGLISGLIIGLFWGMIGDFVCGQIFGLIYEFKFRQIIDLINVISYEQLFGMTGVNSEIKPVEILNFSRIKFLKFGSSIGLGIGLASGLGVGFLVHPFIGLTSGLIAVINTAIIFSLSGKQIEEKILPNQGVRNSAMNSLLVGIPLPLVLAISFWPLYGLNSVIHALGYTGSLWLIFGGLTCIQHFTLRLLLYQSRLIPWNYARFLNYSAERLLFQRVGGRYSFVHKLVQEHFAKMSSDLLAVK